MLGNNSSPKAGIITLGWHSCAEMAQKGLGMCQAAEAP